MEEIQLYLEEAKELMQKAVNHTVAELLKIRAGKAMPNLLDGIMVAYYGSPTSLQQVASVITSDLILSKLRVFNHSLQQDFGVRKPRLAVLGLNPHAGDNGLLGKEESQIIEPAIKKSNEQGIWAVGPFPADGFFGNGTWKQFDGVLAMYHDQGLIPFKSIAFHHGVNFTAGLPIVRTSPDHGTAYDIAGKNQASEESFREAVYMAIDIFRNRKLYKEITANPLPPAPRRERERERY
jgi:4-hydroxythreonine-4-phosphate dehydrogenase